MRRSIKLTMLSLVAALGMWGAGPARSAEITVYLNQATATGVRELAAGFEKATGNKVNVDFEVGQALYQKLVAGAPGDLTSLGLGQFDDFIKQGKVVPGSVVEYGRVGNGVAVKAGAPKPDISTPEAFKQAMLDAKSIGHTKVGTGPFNTTDVPEARHLRSDQGQDQNHRGQAGRRRPYATATSRSASSRPTSSSPSPGPQYLGPLPPELMEYGAVGVGLLTVSKQPEVAQGLHQVHGRSGERGAAPQGRHGAAAELITAARSGCRIILRRLIDVDDVHRHGGGLAVAPDGEIDGPPDADPFELVRQVERAADGNAVGGGDDVALHARSRARAPQARALRGRSRANMGNDDAVNSACFAAPSSAGTIPMPAVGIRPLTMSSGTIRLTMSTGMANPSAVLGASSR